MYKLNFFFTLIIYVGFSINVEGQGMMPIKVRLTLQKSDISTYKDFSIQFKITNNDPLNKIPFRSCLRYGYDFRTKNIEAPDLVFEVQKFVGNYCIKVNMKPELSDDSKNLCLDSTGIEIYDTLSQKKALEFVKNICSYYAFEKAKYKVRVKLNIPATKGLKSKFIYSNWLYFNVISSEIDYSDLGN